MSTLNHNNSDLDLDISLINQAVKLVNGEFIRVELSGFVKLDSIFQLDLESLSSNYLFGLTDPIGELKQWLYDRFKELAAWFASIVDSAIRPVKGVLDSVLTAITRIPAVILDGVKSAVDLIIRAITVVGADVTRIFEFLKNIGGTVASALKGYFDAVVNSIIKLGEILVEFSKYIQNFGAIVLGGISNIYAFIQQIGEFLRNIPSVLVNIFGNISVFFTNLWEKIQEFTRDPVEWFKKNITSPLWTGIIVIGEKIFEGLTTLWNYISPGLQWLWNTVTNSLSLIGNWIVSGAAAAGSLLVKIAELAISAMKGIIEAAMSLLKSIIIDPIIKLFVPSSPSPLEEAAKFVEKMITDLNINFWDQIWTYKKPGFGLVNVIAGFGLSATIASIFYLFGLIMQLPFRAVSFTVRNFAFTLSQLEYMIQLQLALLGIGASYGFSVLKAIGASLATIADEMLEHSKNLINSMAIGLGLYYATWFRRFIAIGVRNLLPLEIPAYTRVIESYRRALVADKVPREIATSGVELAATMIDFLKVKGYSDFLLHYAFAAPDSFHFTVKDRFGVDRRIPLADAWRMPSPSDVVRMMVRDIIIDPDQFKKIMAGVGYFEDVAVLYFLLRFRYPPPERLADFYWRGVAGVLWLPFTLEEPLLAEKLRIPTKANAPAALNFNTSILNEMISLYMKWHDYSPFPWKDGFPTDKSIIVELMADLPDKADLRWFARWGIFEHLSKLGVGLTTSVAEMITKAATSRGVETVSTRVTPEIALDVSMLARMLEARGLHPYLASLSAVAEIHVALTDEMTLLRTGFLEMFRWGMATLDATEHLMSGLFIIKFTTGYIDPSTGRPVTYIYNKPIFWLPAERRLLQLRAVMDRAYMLWRDVVRETASGVRRLGLTPEEASRILVKYFDKLKSAVSSQVKAISGVEWSPILDKEYIDLWLEYGAVLREVEVKTWIRHYTTRIMAWITYRISYGWVKKEDFYDLVDTLVKMGWLTTSEAEFFKIIVDKIIGMVKRETIPSPLTLATMAEYMVIDKEIIDKVFEDQRVVEEYRDLYRRYIMVKPFKTDYKSLLSVARRALVRGVIDEKTWEQYAKRAIEEFGFKPAEVEILREIAELEMKMRESEAWQPTILTLITISEVVPEALKLIELYPVKKEFAYVVKKYAQLKPLVDDVKALLSSYYRAKRYAAYYGQTIPPEIERQVLDFFKLVGITDLEKSIRDLAEYLNELVDVWRAGETLPTLSTLAAMAEYIEIPMDYLQRILITRRVEKIYAELWLKYIQVRSISTEVNRVVSAFTQLYVRYSVPEDLVKIVKELMARGGWTLSELQIFEIELYIRRQYRILTLLVPTIRGFISDAQYLPAWDKLLEDLFKTYGLLVEQYKQQLEYYKRLAKNRRLWRHFSWYRTQLTYAYQHGAIDEKKAREALKKFVDIGLLDPDEVEVIIEGMKLRSAGYQAYRAVR